MKKLLFVNVLILIIFIILLDLSIRLFIPHEKWKLSISWQFIEHDNILGWKHKSNLDETYKHFTGKINYKTNNDGIRPYTSNREKENNSFRIMLVGDSTVDGVNVPEEKSLHKLLEQKLNNYHSNKKFEVINAGVEGYAADQVLLSTIKHIEQYKPDMVIYGFYINDLFFLRSIHAQNNNQMAKKPKFDFIEGNLVYPEPIKNYSQIKTDYMFDRTTFVRILRISAIYQFLQPYIFKLRNKLIKDRYTRLSINRNVFYEKNAIEEIDKLIFSAIIAEFKKITERNNILFAVYPTPDVYEVDEKQAKALLKKFDIPFKKFNKYAIEDFLINICNQHNILLFRMVDYFIYNKEKDKDVHLLPRDFHLNAYGHEIITDKLLLDINKNFINR